MYWYRRCTVSNSQALHVGSSEGGEACLQRSVAYVGVVYAAFPEFPERSERPETDV